MMVASVVFPKPGGPYSNTWSSASPRDFAASIATLRFSLTLFCPMNSRSRLGRSFSSNDASSSTGTADTSRSLISAACRAGATGADSKLKSGAGQLWRTVENTVRISPQRQSVFTTEDTEEHRGSKHLTTKDTKDHKGKRIEYRPFVVLGVL